MWLVWNIILLFEDLQQALSMLQPRRDLWDQYFGWLSFGIDIGIGSVQTHQKSEKCCELSITGIFDLGLILVKGGLKYSRISRNCQCSCNHEFAFLVGTRKTENIILFIIWCLFGGCRLVDTCQILIPTVEINPTYKKGNANLKLVRWHDSIQLMFNVECSDSIVVGSRSLRYESNHVIILISGLNCLFYFLCVGLISTVGIKIWPQVYRRQQQKRHQIILCFPFSWSQLKKRTCSGSCSGSKVPNWQWKYVPCTLRLTARWKWLCIRMWLGAVRILSRVVFYWGLLWINHVVQHFQLMLDVFAMHCIGDSDSVQHRNWEGRW